MIKVYIRTSVSIDEAIANLLNLLDGPAIFRARETDPSEVETEADELTYDLAEVLQEDFDEAWSNLAEAKLEHAPKSTLAKRAAQLEVAKRQIEFANICRCAIDHELLKPSPALMIDPNLSRNTSPHITLQSLRQWADTNPAIKRVRVELSAAELKAVPDMQGPDPTKPWWQPAEGDPDPEHDWYTPARYFARLLVEADPTLRAKRNLLANQLVSKMTDNRIFKHGRVKPFAPGTIRKALTNVRF